MDQLRAHQARYLVINRRLQEDDVFLEELAVQIVSTLAPTGLLDHIRNEIVHRIEIHDSDSSSVAELTS